MLTKFRKIICLRTKGNNYQNLIALRAPKQQKATSLLWKWNKPATGHNVKHLKKMPRKKMM
jgi:hypothetical protein